jgi:hypothetical protein
LKQECLARTANPREEDVLSCQAQVHNLLLFGVEARDVCDGRSVHLDAFVVGKGFHLDAGLNVKRHGEWLNEIKKKRNSDFDSILTLPPILP